MEAVEPWVCGDSEGGRTTKSRTEPKSWLEKQCTRTTGEDDGEDVRTSLTFRLRGSPRSTSVAVTLVTTVVVVVVVVVATVVVVVVAFCPPRGKKKEGETEKDGKRPMEIEVSWQTVVD